MSSARFHRDLTRRVRLATRSVAAAQFASQIVSLLVLAGLYRLVEQSDFGLMGMAIPLVLLFRSLASAGLTVAAVQQEKLSPAESSSLFWLHLGLGTLVALVTAACAPLLALVYRTPQVAGVCAALAGTSVVAGLGSQHQALLERQLRLGRLAIARLGAQTAGGAAGLCAAWTGWGVWALVVQQYVELLVLDAGLWLAEPFRPQSPARGESIWRLISFSGWFTLSGLMFAIAHNLDKILLAVFVGSTRAGQAALGMYAQSYNLMIKPVYLVSTPLTGVMLPALSRARSDRDAYRDLLTRFYRLMAVALMPCGFGLFVVAEDVMLVLGGPAWQPAGAMLRALSPAVLVLGSVNIAGSVFSSVGRADRLAAGSIVVTGLLATGLAAGMLVGHFTSSTVVGLVLGVAWSYSLTWALVVFSPYIWHAARTIRIRPAMFVMPQLRACAAAAGMAAAIWLLRMCLIAIESPPLLRLALVVIAGVMSYAILAQGELRFFRQQLVDFRPDVR
jgi:PST family polysaccharide transporter